MFKKAIRQQRKFKGCICGPSGSGKTWTALTLAMGLKNGGRVALLDSERSSASLYADNFDFDHGDLETVDVDHYISSIKEAEKAGYDVLVIDSASHAWESVLEAVEDHNTKSRGGSSFKAWGEVGTPIYKKLLAAVLDSNMHIICTMRSKTDYVMEEYTDSKGNKRSKPVKVGLAPVFRSGGEYEFDVVANMDLDNNFMVEKSRLSCLPVNKVIRKPGLEIGKTIRDWLAGGAENTNVNVKVSKVSSAQSKQESTIAPASPVTLTQEQAFQFILTQGESFAGTRICDLDQSAPAMKVKLTAYANKYVSALGAEEKAAIKLALAKVKADLKAMDELEKKRISENPVSFDDYPDVDPMSLGGVHPVITEDAA